jgi:hypothetical protein
MKKVLFIMLLTACVFGQNTTSNVITSPQMVRVLLTGTQTKVVHFALPPAKSYFYVAPDTSASYVTGATAVINPPDAVLWSGNAGITLRLTKQAAEESDSLQVIIKPLDYNGVTFANDSCWCDWSPTTPPPSYAFSAKELNWTDGLRYSTSLTGYLPVNCYGVMVILKQKAMNVVSANAYCEVELTVQ